MGKVAKKDASISAGLFPRIKVRCTLTEEALGMTAPTPELLQKFIDLQNTKLEKKKKAAIDDDKAKEEVELLKNQIAEMKNNARGYTVFPRDKDGCPIFWDYQIKGMFKDAFKALLESDLNTSLFKKETCGFTKWSSDRLVDQLIFPHPRRIRIMLPEGGEIGRCDRPLRTRNPQTGQEGNAIASSETVPAGSVIEFEVELLKKDILPQVKAVFEYGRLRGLAGWRNSGKGRYEYEIVEDL